MIRLFFTLIVLFALIEAYSMREPDPGDGTPIALPTRTDGPFQTEDEAQRCGAILGRTLQCAPPRADRGRLIDFCSAGLNTASGEVDHRLYEAFLDGTRDGQRNAHGWSCERIKNTLASPPLSGDPGTPGPRD